MCFHLRVTQPRHRQGPRLPPFPPAAAACRCPALPCSVWGQQGSAPQPCIAHGSAGPALGPAAPTSSHQASPSAGSRWGQGTQRGMGRGSVSFPRGFWGPLGSAELLLARLGIVMGTAPGTSRDQQPPSPQPHHAAPGPPGLGTVALLGMRPCSPPSCAASCGDLVTALSFAGPGDHRLYFRYREQRCLIWHREGGRWGPRQSRRDEGMLHALGSAPSAPSCPAVSVLG